jgi:hypothetical protein
MTIRATITNRIDDASKTRHQSADIAQNTLPCFFNDLSGGSLIHRKASCACGGGCPRCGRVIQAKSKIGQPNDVYEQEADRIADQVMRMPEPAIHPKPT